MKISFSNENAAGAEGVVVGLVAEGSALPPWLGGAEEAVSQAAAEAGFKGAEGDVLDLFAPPGLAAKRLLLVGAGKAEELSSFAVERLGGRIAAALQERKVERAAVAADLAEEGGEALKGADFAARLASGMMLRNYAFDRYKSRKKEEKRLSAATVLTADEDAAKRAFAPLESLAESVHFARDLVNEPGNVLTPAAFARRVRALESLGLEVEILDEKALGKLGFNALLAVGQGSANRPRVAVMKWNGGGRDEAPVAFVGKGVTFDSGGISIKPSQGMEDMKGDMGGAAAVAGAMRALAARGASVNAVGVIGLVENMPDGRAQRPGDVVKSLSGQTIAVLNTDAEGRLVLADCLTYAKDTFKPALMIDLATLTGAILVALGKEYAGLFANDDDLASALSAAGEATGEKVWRLPLGKPYDKLIDHDLADMKNIGGRNAGSITAAQFLKRFVGDVPWAHLDVAGTAMAAEKSDINPSWGSGWGVRLLDAFVRARQG